MKNRKPYTRCVSFAVSLFLAYGLCFTVQSTKPIQAADFGRKVTKILANQKTVKVCCFTKSPKRNAFLFRTKKTHEKGCTITKIKSSKPSVIKVKKDTKGAYPGFRLWAKKPGRAKVTVTAKKGGKTVKQTFRFVSVKYHNPFLRLKLGDKDITKKFSKTVPKTIKVKISKAKDLTLTARMHSSDSITLACYQYDYYTNDIYRIPSSTVNDIFVNQPFTRYEDPLKESIMLNIKGIRSRKGLLFGLGNRSGSELDVLIHFY